MKTQTLHQIIKRQIFFLAFFSALGISVSSCQLEATNSSGSGSDSDTVSTTAFPTSLAVASPVDYSEDSSNLSVSALKHVSGKSKSYYARATERIELILESSSPSLCLFHPEEFLTQETDAGCFGPTVEFDDHPDATSSADASGELPHGDLGLWLETDEDTGNACAGAQLNKRMEGVRDRTTSALMGLASLICTANSNGISLPDATTPTVDLTAETNDLGVADTTFNKAEMSYDSASGTYSYELDLTYAPSGKTYDIVVNMDHTPDTTGVYSGKVSFLVNDSFTGGNCPTANVTHNGSLEYVRTSNEEMAIQVRSGTFCGHDSDGRDADGLVDPADKYDSSNADGWGNNFSILTANYDPTSLDGDFSYAWQAGPQDDNTRVFNMNVASTSTVAFFGYGDDIETSDGSIEGFICNWAGPGADHTLTEYAQYQEVEIDTATGTLTPVASNITYVPVVGCEYDGTGSFVYDTNADGDLSDEDPALDVTLASGTMDLIAGDDLDTDGSATIEEVIDDYGFSLPSM